MSSLIHDILHAADTTYLTHNFHPYPAKFIPQIPRHAIEKYTEPGETVLDPFCGSGTTLVEAMLAGRDSVGVDIHPVATLAASAKTTVLTPGQLSRASATVCEIGRAVADGRFGEHEMPEFHNRDHWFGGCVRRELSLILGMIRESGNARAVKNFLNAAVSAITVSVSNQHSDTRYAAVEKNIGPGRTFSRFSAKAEESSRRMTEFRGAVPGRPRCRVLDGDARDLGFLGAGSADLIVTSPPYPNVYDYYLYHKQRMHWLGMDVGGVKDREMGSRLRYSSLRWPVSTFRDELRECFAGMGRALKPGGRAVVVMGDSVVQGQIVDGRDMVKSAARKSGFRLVDSMRYELDDISRTFHAGFRTKGKKEHIVVLKNHA